MVTEIDFILFFLNAGLYKALKVSVLPAAVDNNQLALCVEKQSLQEIEYCIAVNSTNSNRS